MGGGYSDIADLYSAENAFKHLNNKKVWIIGYSEPYGLAVAPTKFKANPDDYKSLTYDLIKHYRYISWADRSCRPYTNLPMNG